MFSMYMLTCQLKCTLMIYIIHLDGSRFFDGDHCHFEPSDNDENTAVAASNKGSWKTPAVGVLCGWQPWCYSGSERIRNAQQ